MKRSISDIVRNSGLAGMLLKTGDTEWIGIWLPLRVRPQQQVPRKSTLGDALARAAAANARVGRR